MPPQPPHTAKSGPEQAPPAAAARAAPDGRCGPLSSAARSRAWRRRQKIGAALVQLEIPPEALAELVERGFSRSGPGPPRPRRDRRRHRSGAGRLPRAALIRGRRDGRPDLAAPASIRTRSRRYRPPCAAPSSPRPPAARGDRAAPRAAGDLDLPDSSAALEPGTVLAVNPAALAVAISPVPRLDLSRETTLHMDTAPAQLVDGSAASPARSAWQTDVVATRLILQIGYVLRAPGSVSIMAGVSW